MKHRHRMLEELLRILGLPEETIRVDVEGIEHHVSPQTLARLNDLVYFFQEQPEVLIAYEEYRHDSSLKREKLQGEENTSG